MLIPQNEQKTVTVFPFHPNRKALKQVLMYWISFIIQFCALGTMGRIEGSVVVPSFGSILHSDYLRLQIPASWPAWNQSLDTDLVKVGETGRGTGWSLFISCGQQRTRYITVARRRTGCGSRERRPSLCSNHRRQPAAFSGAPLSSTGSHSTALLKLSMQPVRLWICWINYIFTWNVIWSCQS